MTKLKKSAHTLETEELLELLEKDEAAPEELIVFRNDVLTFISTFGIEPGEDRVKQHTLYAIYKAWSSDPMKKNDFLLEMRKFLPTIKMGAASGFCINQSAIKLTHSAYKYYSNEGIRVNSKLWAKHFENFLKFHSLSPGKYWINGEILYFIYDKYCNATGLDKHHTTYMNKVTFKVYCGLYLEQKTTKHGKQYAISDNIQSFFQIGQLERMQKEYAKEEKDKKKSSKTRKSPPKSKPKNKI